ncbi:hypothetical protein [Nostoc sp. 'Lobaria pulmonaria (5183) cyanobiont']|uniref:hypothetical protein n=1 Tax=Nostoc sp. 'Lobaria pulmonaria (5183) cyanobiont' TaxID=1618022 RepID=UPI000CF3405A|nr:hypothetical protein [Nostoc sp. 'Lobaria pulmonaria (5183) cyanobiont']
MISKLIPRQIFLAWSLGSTAGITLSLIKKVQAVRLPQHLKDVLILLSGLRPKNNIYQHEPTPPTLVSWKGIAEAEDYTAVCIVRGYTMESI